MLLMRSEGNQSLAPSLPPSPVSPPNTEDRSTDRPPRRQRTPPRPTDRSSPPTPSAHYQMRSTRMDGVRAAGTMEDILMRHRCSQERNGYASFDHRREGGAIRPGKRGCSTAQPSLIFLRLRQTRHAHNNRRQRRRDRIKRDLFNGKSPSPPPGCRKAGPSISKNSSISLLGFKYLFVQDDCEKIRRRFKSSLLYM